MNWSRSTLIALILIAASAQAFPPTSSGDRLNMALLGRWSEGPSSGLVAWGDVIVRGEGGMLVLTDCSDTADPTDIARAEVPVHPRHLLLDGDLLAIRNEYDSEVALLDLSQPGVPVVGFLDVAMPIEAWALDGRQLVLVLVDTDTWVRSTVMVDVSDPGSPVIRDTGLASFTYLYLSGDVLLASDQNTLYRFDVSNPESPAADGSLVLPCSAEMEMAGALLFVVGSSGGGTAPSASLTHTPPAPLPWWDKQPWARKHGRAS